MHLNSLLTIELDLLVLLLVACVAAIALTRLKFPYTVGLVIIGLGLGYLGRSLEALEFLDTLTLSPELILFVFVPPLIFESAINLDSRLLFRNLVPILTLAAPGLLLSTAIVGAILQWGTPLTVGSALLFGSLISATDPVAVIALFKDLGAPKRLAVLVEGESLFNDATAIVTFNIILALIVAGSEFSLATVQQGLVSFLVNFVGGILVGGGLGLLAQYALMLTQKNALVLATLSSIVAYGAFLVADEVFSVSGVIAVVTAGLMVGWTVGNRLKPETRQFVREFWEYIAFLANSLIFLLVGLTIVELDIFGKLSQERSLPIALGLTLVAVLVSRAVVVFGLIPVLNQFQANKIDRRYQLVSYWGGLRGAVCLALALSLSSEFPNRDLMVVLTLGVAIFTLLIPGTTIAKLMKTLELDRPTPVDEFDAIVAKLAASQAALTQVSQLGDTLTQPQAEVIQGYQATYTQAVETTRQALTHQWQSANPDEPSTQRFVWLEAIAIEQQIYRQLYDQGFLSETLLSQFTLRVNLKQDAVLSGQVPPVLADQDTLEMRWRRMALSLCELFGLTDWMEQLQSWIGLAEIERLAISTYVGQTVPDRLRSFFATSGLDEAILTDCIQIYQQQRTLALEPLKDLYQRYPELQLRFQTRLCDRVGIFAQTEAIATLAKAGNINTTVASQLLQTLEAD